MSDETPEQTEDESVNYTPAIAIVVSSISIPVIFTLIMNRRRARQNQEASKTPLTIEELVIALKETPTIYFCNN